MYRFVREDTGEIIEVDFETNMTQDVAGYITLPNGSRARRVNDFPQDLPRHDLQNANRDPPVSDNLGCPVHQLAELEEDRVRHGFNGVEFRPDPLCPTFYQVHFSSYAERDKYMAHRGFFDKNKTIGAALSAKDLTDAEEMAKNLGK